MPVAAAEYPAVLTLQQGCGQSRPGSRLANTRRLAALACGSLPTCLGLVVTQCEAVPTCASLPSMDWRRRSDQTVSEGTQATSEGDPELSLSEETHQALKLCLEMPAGPLGDWLVPACAQQADRGGGQPEHASPPFAASAGVGAGTKSTALQESGASLQPGGFSPCANCFPLVMESWRFSRKLTSALLTASASPSLGLF